MTRIGIFTFDFKFYHDVIRDLKTWRIPFTSIDSPNSIPRDVSVILSSVKDEHVLPNQIKADVSNRGIRMALPRLLNKTHFSKIVIGIDPGPKPGVAVIGDNVLIEAFECPSVKLIHSEVEDIVESYLYRDAIIKVGDGDKPNRDLILRKLKKIEVPIKIVDEANTSAPHKIHDNALSAARIAMTDGAFSNVNFNEKVSRKDAYEREFITLRSLIN